MSTKRNMIAGMVLMACFSAGIEVCAVRSSGAEKAGAGVSVPGAIAIKMDQEVQLNVQSTPIKINGADVRTIGIGRGTFRLGEDGHLTATLHAGVMQHAKMDCWIYAAVFDAEGRMLGTASHKEAVEYISLGRILMVMRDIPLDFGVSSDFKQAAYVVVTVSNPIMPRQ